MKKILFLTICALLTCGNLEAQSFLKKIGKAVEKSVTKEIDNLMSKKSADKKSNDTNNNTQQKQRPTNGTESGSQSHSSAHNTPVVDRGENIPREPGLDYIDEWGINHGGGILIDTVLWAPVNCGYHATYYPYGKLYQWGRKDGQGYGIPFFNEDCNVNPDSESAKIVPAPVTPDAALKYPDNFYARSKNGPFNWTNNNMKLWNNFSDDGIISKNRAYDPCPEGWRVADLHDYYCLSQNYSQFTEMTDKGPKGRWFSGSKPYSTDVPRIFLPAAGIRDANGVCGGRDKYGYYWSSRHAGGECLIWHLKLDDYSAEVNPHAYPHEGYPVRCVKDVKGQRLR